MRLIDADKLRHELIMGHDLVGAKYTDMADTVKAIPIEWIKGYLTPFQVHHDSLREDLKENDGPGWVVEVLQTMLREWEKENEE